MREKQPETEDKIELKPFMGIRPGVYLTVIYSVILLAVLFFLLVFPGLKNPGAVLLLKTEPDGAAIRVDDVYMGTSRDKIFVSKGPHILEAVLAGFQPSRINMEIPGRVFGSLFFPLRVPVEFTLKTGDAAAAFAQEAADFAAWSFGGEPTAAWQIPLSLSEGAYRIGPENNPAAAEALKAASRFTVTRAALRDLVRAKILLDNCGLSPSPAGLIGSVSDMLVFLSENPASAAWLSGLLPAESAALIKGSNWHKNPADITYAARLQDTSAVRRLEIAGLSFTSIDAGTLKLLEPLPYGAATNAFWISENPVPRFLFETFLNENPSWREQIEAAQISPAPQAAGFVSDVSWFAAEAFCRWLESRLPPSMAKMEIRLPTEDEWEHAAGSGIVSMGEAGWEWCADPFVPLPFIKAAHKAVQAVGSPERALRGRSAQQSSAASENRASLPPDFSSPFVTFRPVIAEKDSEK